MPDSLQTSVALKWLADEFATRVVQVLDSMTDRQHTCNWSPDSTESAPITWWEFPLNGAAAGAFYIGASEGSWLQLGGSVLAAAGVDSDPETARTTFCEVLSQVLSAVGQSISARVHSEATFGIPAVNERPADLARATLAFAVSAADQPVAELLLAMAGSVVTALASERSPHPAPEPRSSTALPAPSSGPAELPKGTPPALDLLLDVEMPVSVSFGRTQLQLKDVMKLSSGSIVELNRGVSEPVEVIVNNCVVARGEVVVIEGNYGVRIDEIISPQERLRTLK